MIYGLKLQNFRNYDSCQLDFAPGLNCLVGANGQGKSNILEAICYLSLLRSFRTNIVKEMKQFNKDFFTVGGRVSGEAGMETELSVYYSNVRRLIINKAMVYRATDFINRFVCVTFIPDDLSLVQGSPGVRRRFLDISISQTSQTYLRHLQAYKEALHSRNVMLRDVEKYPKSTITAYDSIIAREGAAIEVVRRDFVDKLNVRLNEMSPNLLGDSRGMQLKYLSKVGKLMQELKMSQEDIERLFRKTLEECYDRDCRNGNTENGPHRSDFVCLLDNMMMLKYASQGECRITSLALRLACLGIVGDCVGSDNVTLLVDDVVGELDAQHRNNFFNALNGVGQIIFACTSLSQDFPRPERVFIVRGGKISMS